MANQGAKKRKEENRKHMVNLLRLIIASNVIYILVRMLVFHSTFIWKHWIGLIVTSIAYVMPYKQLDSMAKPTYSDDGELMDGGYLHDLIYITSFVQIMSILSGKFWWTSLVIPAFGAYKVVGLLKRTLGGSEGEVEEEKRAGRRGKRWRRRLQEAKLSGPGIGNISTLMDDLLLILDTRTSLNHNL